ncbi:hypothetical protein RND81_13G169800 [Saponaria officinalis]|uniref:No apical meristem-associated C-terminal domain-containing protein n=1 Tax=Saponaria officinalis TaxID=3572 RepID=A0AAW1GYS1_SAPOF
MNKNPFSLAEDEALISSFMQHSQDPTVGTNQKKRDLWVKVKNLFDEAQKANPSKLRERSVGMLATPTSQTDPESQGSGKRSRNHITSDDGEGSISKRPMGVKAAKMNKGKGKGNVVQMEFLAETIKGYSEVQIQRMEMTKQKEARKQKQVEIELRKLELDEKRQQDEERAMKWSVLQTLLQRSDLNPQEEELKMTLLKDIGVI